MRLPGHHFAGAEPPPMDNDVAPNNRLMPNQTAKEDQHARIAQHAGERNRRHAVIGVFVRCAGS